MAIEIFEVQGMKKRKRIWFCIAVMLLLCLCGCEEEELPEEVPVNTTGQNERKVMQMCGFCCIMKK